MKDTTDLPPDEVYVVTELRAMKDGVLKQDPNGRLLLCAGPIAVCTFDVMFRMLGRGVLELDPTATRMDRYQLTEAWKPDA